jgi:cytosine/adenosine deaminase-related metal-dependent hydrolase
MKALFAHHALLADGWRKNVLLQWDDRGNFTAVQADAVAAPGIPSARLVMPGMINLHSHAFQRALGGLTEVAGDSRDSFWTWRDLMYRFARNITPEQMEAIAAQLYSECLRHGYTSMCEFHYVQRAPDGTMYPQASETAQRVIAAARQAGIGITMLRFRRAALEAGAGALPHRCARRAEDHRRTGTAARRAGGSRRGAALAARRFGGADPRSAGPFAESAPGAHPHRRAAGRSAAVAGLLRQAPGGIPL